MPAIVLIETDDITLELYQRELSKFFTVFGFTELNQVLETITQQDIQAVVIEPEINGGEGWELIQTIHTIFPERTLPVIVCSTRDLNKTDRLAEVSEYLTKPVLPRTLREKTLELLGPFNKGTNEPTITEISESRMTGSEYPHE